MQAPIAWQRELGWHKASPPHDAVIEFGLCKPDYVEVVQHPQRGRELVVIDAKVPSTCWWH